MTRNWAKWITWPAAPQNEEQANIEDIDRAIKERRRDPLPDDVDTSERELVEMAEVVDTHGHDPVRFLRILHQDADEFGVLPEDVYETDHLHEGPYWPEVGFALTMDELEWLASVCCDVADSADPANDDEYAYSPIERLVDLCDFLTYAREIAVPPSIGRGDQ